MFQTELTLKELAAYIDRSYYSARRLAIRFGGYRNIGNSNPDYEIRLVPISQADEIKKAIMKRGRLNNVTSADGSLDGGIAFNGDI